MYDHGYMHVVSMSLFALFCCVKLRRILADLSGSWHYRKKYGAVLLDCRRGFTKNYCSICLYSVSYVSLPSRHCTVIPKTIEHDRTVVYHELGRLY